MTTQNLTRKWQGAVLSVRNADDDDWIDFAACIDFSMPGVAAAQIDASTAASTVDEFRLGLPDSGQATFNVFDDMDSAFLVEMDNMQNNGDTREFKLTITEGDATERTFSAYVVDAPINGQYNNLWKMTLTLKVVADDWWTIPAPTIASLDETTGDAAGGDVITITGTNFVVGATTVIIGGNTVAAVDVTVTSKTSLHFTTPAHVAATVDVKVNNGSDSNTLAGAFTYA